MSTPDSTTETPGLDTTAHAAAPSSDVKAPWWKRLLGRG